MTRHGARAGLPPGAGRREPRRRVAATVLALAFATIALPLDTASAALRLIMVEERGCRYCKAWDDQVGQSYVRSPEAEKAPLVRVTRASKLIAGFGAVPFTPTFILAEGEHEVGRITGYPGPIYFWEELAALLGRAQNERSQQ